MIMERVAIKCTNKLCGYEAYGFSKGEKLLPKNTCPKCGFFTLVDKRSTKPFTEK